MQPEVSLREINGLAPANAAIQKVQDDEVGPKMFVDPTKETFAAFRANDREGPIHMLNLVRLHSRAAYPDGREALKHRQAAVSDSRLVRLAPLEPGASFGP
jgi:hypothetical protein